MKKFALIFISSIISIFILLVFILINFPYDSLLKRFNSYLKSEYSLELKTHEIKYRFPLKFTLEDVNISRRDNSLKCKIDNAGLKLTPLSFSKGENFNLECNTINVNSSYVDLSRSKLLLQSNLNFLKLLNNDYNKAFHSLKIFIANTEVDKFSYSGLEFKSFNIGKFDLSVGNSGNAFDIERGIINSDLFSANVSGKITYLNALEVSLGIKLSNEFYKRYADLKDMIDNVADNGTIKIDISGNIKRPRFNIIH